MHDLYNLQFLSSGGYESTIQYRSFHLVNTPPLPVAMLGNTVLVATKYKTCLKAHSRSVCEILFALGGMFGRLKCQWDPFFLGGEGRGQDDDRKKGRGQRE